MFISTRCVKKHQKYNHAVADNSTTLYMVVKCNVVSIILVHSVTGHSVVAYLNTLSNDGSIYVIIRFNIICLAFSDELVNSDIMSHDPSFILPQYIIHVLANNKCCGFGFRRFWVVSIITVSLNPNHNPNLTLTLTVIKLTLTLTCTLLTQSYHLV